jgi:hypothetical protein
LELRERELLEQMNEFLLAQQLRYLRGEYDHQHLCP